MGGRVQGKTQECFAGFLLNGNICYAATNKLCYAATNKLCYGATNKLCWQLAMAGLISLAAVLRRPATTEANSVGSFSKFL